MPAPKLTQTARHVAPGASRALLVVLAACLVFAAGALRSTSRPTNRRASYPLRPAERQKPPTSMPGC